MSLYNAELEEALLGGLLLNGHMFGEVNAVLESDYFYLDDHSDMFRCMREVHKIGLNIDRITVYSMWNGLASDYLLDLEKVFLGNQPINTPFISGSIFSYVAILRGYYRLRIMESKGIFEGSNISEVISIELEKMQEELRAYRKKFRDETRAVMGGNENAAAETCTDN